MNASSGPLAVATCSEPTYKNSSMQFLPLHFVWATLLHIVERFHNKEFRETKSIIFTEKSLQQSSREMWKFLPFDKRHWSASTAAMLISSEASWIHIDFSVLILWEFHCGFIELQEWLYGFLFVCFIIIFCHDWNIASWNLSQCSNFAFLHAWE